MDTNANTVCVSGVRAGVASLPMPGFVREHASERKIVQNSLSLSLSLTHGAAKYTKGNYIQTCDGLACQRLATA